MNGFVQERAILNNLKDPVLLAAFATPTRGGSTAASALSYLVQHWQAEPIVEFGAEHLYSYTRIRPQLMTNEDGSRQLQWPTNTVFLARPEGIDRSFLILIGVEPSFGWQDLIQRIETFCHRNGITKAITLHSTPAGVSHRQSTPVVAVYGSQESRNSFGLPQTTFHDGPMSFGAVLSLSLNASGCQTTDLIALEPFYTPGLPDAQAALALIGVIDRHFGISTPVDTLAETANSQRDLYERFVAGSDQLNALAEHLEQGVGPVMLEQRAGDSSELSLTEVMDEIDQILSSS